MGLLKKFSGLLAVLLAAVSPSAGVASQEAPVTLTVRPVLEAGHYRALDVSLTFPGKADGETEVKLPSEWGGERELYRAIHGLSAPGATLTTLDKPDMVRLRHVPGAAVTLRYQVTAGAGGPPQKSGGNDYRVRLEKDHFFALGNAFVVQPAHIAQDAPARFVIEGLPKGARFASDMEHQGKGRTLRFEDLLESVLIGGAIRIIDAGSGARLALHGSLAARDDAGWRKAFSTIASSQRSYWGAADEPYLVTVLVVPPARPESTSVGGTGRSDAFAFFSTSNAPAALLDRGMAHEMMHTWIPFRIGGFSKDRQEAEYWLSEGFTDWAAWRVMVRSRLWTPSDFAQRLNEQVLALDRSPVGRAPNNAIVEGFWKSPEVQKLPYDRGMLLAHYWDGKVRRATQGLKDLDDVLLSMQAMAAGANAASAPGLFKRAMQSVAGLDVSEDLARHVDDGIPPELPEDAFAPCGTFAWRERPVFHRGLDIEATQKSGGLIQGVRVDGPAYRAGLRDGMVLIRRAGGEIGNPDIEIAYEVIGQGRKQTLRWMPEGVGREKIRSLTMIKDLAGPELEACYRRLSGL